MRARGVTMACRRVDISALPDPGELGWASGLKVAVTNSLVGFPYDRTPQPGGDMNRLVAMADELYAALCRWWYVITDTIGVPQSVRSDPETMEYLVLSRVGMAVFRIRLRIDRPIFYMTPHLSRPKATKSVMPRRRP